MFGAVGAGVELVLLGHLEGFGQSSLLALEGAPTGFAVDGPRDPSRSVQPGAVWLASVTGCPALPFSQ